MEKPNLEKLQPDALIDLLESSTINFRWSRSSIYKVAFEKYTELGEKDRAEEMRSEILIFDLSTHASPKKRFSEVMSGTERTGPGLTNFSGT